MFEVDDYKERKFIASFFFMLITIIYCIVTIYVIFGTGYVDFVPIIPGGTRFDIIILFIGVPILCIIPLIFLKIITIINFRFMKQFQKSYEFYYVNLGEHRFESSNIIARAFLPVLLAIAISQLINSISGISEGVFGGDPISSIIMLSLMLAPVTSFLLLPVWVFKDSGIIRVHKRSEKRFPPEITYFGKIQHQSYRGFAGITTPILYFITMSVLLRANISFDITTLVVFLFPLFLIGFYMPMMLIYESIIPKLSEKIKVSLKLEPLNIETVSRNLMSYTKEKLNE